MWARIRVFEICLGIETLLSDCGIIEVLQAGILYIIREILETLNQLNYFRQRRSLFSYQGIKE